MVRLKDYYNNDTIAAIATYPAKSALGVIKVSGPKAVDYVSRIFLPKKNKKLKEQKTYTLHYGWIVDRRRGRKIKFIDEVLVSIMKAPNSYTCEDVVEISSHGGQLVLNYIMDLLVREGIRVAYPGEFSWRAFINGRIDLVELQSIQDIIEVKSEQGLEISAANLRGAVSSFLKGVKDELKSIFSQTEAVINFPEEGIQIDLPTMRRRLRKLRDDIFRCCQTSSQAKLFKKGVKCVICGKSNVGKSTLFNRLLKEERVIVSDIPGTTRDVIEESIYIKGIPITIYDTAGILEPRDFIEEKALKLGEDKFKEADLVIFMLDYSRPLSKEDKFLLEKVWGKDIIFVVNKIDLKKKLDLRMIARYNKPIVKISALKDIALDKLEDVLHSVISRYADIGKEKNVVLSDWQISLLEQIKGGIDKVLTFIDKGYTLDFINLGLKDVLEDLGKLVGEIIDEEILENIFSNFCIGK